jgi:signal recognition particle GTPase
MFDNLSIKLEKAFQTLKGQGRITEINVATTAKEIRKALIDADVNYKVAKEVTDDIRERQWAKCAHGYFSVAVIGQNYQRRTHRLNGWSE